MAVRGSGKALLLVGTLLAFGSNFVGGTAEAARPSGRASVQTVAHRSAGPAPASSRNHSAAAEGPRHSAGRKSAGRVHEARGEFRAERGLRFASLRKGGKSRGFVAMPALASVSPDMAGRDYDYSAESRGMSCVPFARINSGIEVAGNAGSWWGNAVGVYERGGRPEVGSVLNFRATGRMPMGHVAVVSNVLNPRIIEIDHSNWSGKGRVTRNVRVVDVSERNDWSAVRVALPQTATFGSIYPTYGFIYDRPDRGVMVANNGSAPTLVDMNAAPADLRPRVLNIAARTSASSADQYDEVAEAPDDMPAPRAHRTLVRRAKAAPPSRSSSRRHYR